MKIEFSSCDPKFWRVEITDFQAGYKSRNGSLPKVTKMFSRIRLTMEMVGVFSAHLIWKQNTMSVD